MLFPCQTDQVKAMIPYLCHFLNPIQSVSMKGSRQVKDGFLSLETIETWIVYVCHSESVSAFEQGMVVGARSTGLCQELQRCWVFHAQLFPVCIKNGPPPKGHPVNMAKL